MTSDDDEERYVVTWIQPVDDFEDWLERALELDAVFSEHIVAREAYQSIDDPNEIMVTCQVRSPKAAIDYLAHDIRDMMDRGGLDFYPPVFAGREVVDLRITRSSDVDREIGSEAEADA